MRIQGQLSSTAAKSKSKNSLKKIKCHEGSDIHGAAIAKLPRGQPHQPCQCGLCLICLELGDKFGGYLRRHCGVNAE